MYQKKAPIRRRKSDGDLTERIDKLRLELAELEVRQAFEVAGAAKAARPGTAGKLTVADLVDLGIILEESVRRGRELTQIEQARLLKYKDSRALNNRLKRLESSLGGPLFQPREKNRSGRMTFDGWEFAMVGILLSDLVELDWAVPQRKYEDILRRLVWSLRGEKMRALDEVDPHEDEKPEPKTGLGKIAAGIRGFHWMDAIGPAEPDEKIPLVELPRPSFPPPSR